MSEKLFIGAVGGTVVGAIIASSVSAAISSFDKETKTFVTSKIDNEFVSKIAGYGAGAGAATGLIVAMLYMGMDAHERQRDIDNQIIGNDYQSVSIEDEDGRNIRDFVPDQEAQRDVFMVENPLRRGR